MPVLLGSSGDSNLEQLEVTVLHGAPCAIPPWQHEAPGSQSQVCTTWRIMGLNKVGGEVP